MDGVSVEGPVPPLMKIDDEVETETSMLAVSMSGICKLIYELQKNV